MTEKKRLLVVDSNALLHRAFHALPPLTTKNGEQTGAVYGFLLILFRAVKDLKPSYIAACFDTAAPTFRHEQFAEYKAQRPKTADELISQMPKIKEVLTALSIPIFAQEGFEADDLIATIAKKASSENSTEVYILTGDKDTLQLVDENIKIYTLGRGVKDMIIYDEAKIVERFGIKPEQMNDFKAMAGDPSDNIAGVEGIGEKTATELLKEFKTLENIYEQAEAKNKNIKERTKGLLLKNKKQAFFARSLVEAKKDVGINFKIKECVFGSFNQKDVEKALNNLEFSSLIKRLPELRSSLNKINQKLF